MRLALPVELLPEDLAARRLGGGGLVAEVLKGALQIGLVRLFGGEQLLSDRLQGVVEAARTLRAPELEQLPLLRLRLSSRLLPFHLHRALAFGVAAFQPLTLLKQERLGGALIFGSEQLLAAARLVDGLPAHLFGFGHDEL